MTRVLVTVGAFAAVLFAGAASARAEDLSGKIGIGADATSTGTQGAQLRYGIMPKLNLQVLLRFDYTSGPDDASATELAFGALAHYSMIEWPGLSFDLIGGLTVQHSTADTGVEGSPELSETDFGLEFGFGPNWWVTDSLSLNLAMAVIVLIDEGPAEEGDDETTFSVFGGPELVGFAGFTFWFR